VPTLVIGGRNDFIMPPQHGPERLHAGIRGSSLRILDQSGHWPFVEETEWFLATMRGWLDSTLPASRAPGAKPLTLSHDGLKPEA